MADPLAIDTRSDVYARGVILYELLAGKMPYMLSRQLNEAVRTIQQSDPAPLSTVSRVYRGDIETIAAKALEKDKNRGGLIFRSMRSFRRALSEFEMYCRQSGQNSTFWGNVRLACHPSGIRCVVAREL
jgi:serine/threonine protein kinase